MEKVSKIPDFETPPSTSKSGARHTIENSSIYIHSNDPKVISKGINIDCLRHYEGGVLPYISDVPYDKRKTNNGINYSNKTDHGSRPMHQTTFSLDKNSNNSKSEFKTHNQKVCTKLATFTGFLKIR